MGIAKSSEFKQYKALAHELTRVQIEDATRAEKLAFFINIYNALVIHGNVAWGGGPTNMWQRYKVRLARRFRKLLYKLCDLNWLNFHLVPFAGIKVDVHVHCVRPQFGSNCAIHQFYAFAVFQHSSVYNRRPRLLTTRHRKWSIASQSEGSW